ncbi:MAG: aldo/keto reductase [Planctomycetota bacterium]|jgi:D-xylose reductase
MTDHTPDVTTIPCGDGAMPAIGLGAWKIPNEMCADLTRQAVEIGYRHFDCACDYGNEVEVGQGLATAVSDGLCSRDDLWVTSKLWNTYHDPKHVRTACERSLSDLQLDELDLYLIHFPIPLAFVPFEERYPPGWFYDPDAAEPCMKHAPIRIAETWGAMEGLVEAGLVKRIGVCNFNTALLRDLLAGSSVRPAALQVEMHPYLTQQRLFQFCRDEGIAATAFSPLGAGSYVQLDMAKPADSVLAHPEVIAIAESHGKTPAQVALRWAVQRGGAAIPKSQKPERLRENLDVFGFALTDDQMAAVDGLDQHRRFNDPGDFCEKAFNTRFPIFD